MKGLDFEKGKPSAEIRELLNNNIIGTPGKSLVYQHKKTNEKLDYINDPAFLSLKLKDKVVGTASFISRKIWNRNKQINACYIRYFAFKNSFRSKSDPISRINKSSLIKDAVSSIFKDDSEWHNDTHFYAYVDPGNIRSKRIIEDFGFKLIGTFRTIFFSRFNPKTNAHIERLDSKDISAFKEKLITFYQDHDFVCLDNIGYQDGYFVFKNNGQIIAGLQANAEHWKIHEIPGGKHLIRIVSNIPYIKRIFNSEFRFLSLEGIFYENGCQHLISGLISHALATYNRNTAIACIDPRSRLYELFQKMDRGFIKNLSKENEIALALKTSEEVANNMLNAPIYVSSFDNM